MTRLCGLSCSLTSCCDFSGESPDDGRFPVRPSSQIPNAVWRQAASKAGMTTVFRRRSGAHMTSLCRSQSGGPGKHASRSMTRMMQHRKDNPVEDCWQRRASWVALDDSPRQPGTRRVHTTGTARGTHRCRVSGACGQHSRESREGLVGRLGAPVQRRRGV